MFGINFLKNLGITTKFVLWFLFVALVPLTIATHISYNSSRNVLKQEVADSLMAVADNKAHQIEVFLNDKIKNANTLSHSSDILEAIDRYGKAFDQGANSPEYIETDNALRPYLTYYQSAFGFDGLFLIRPDANIVFSGTKKMGESMYDMELYQESDTAQVFVTKAKPVEAKITGSEYYPRSLYEIALNKESQLYNVFIKVRESMETEISDFEYYSQDDKGVVFIALPVFTGADFAGVVAVQMSNRGLYDLVRDYTGLGDTGETLIASKIGNDAVFITPLKFDPRAAFRRKVSLESGNSVNISKAVKGEEGLGVSVDYRGKTVLAVWKHIPLFRWGMVVKMDTDEIYASAGKLRDKLMKISLALLVLVVIMAVVIAHSVSSPVKELTQVSGTIAGGDLQARAKVAASDEIGELARSFNDMTDKLVEAKANVEEQKRLLEKANKELDSFVYTVSHDLRAPLRGVTSFANFLEEDYRSKFDEEGKNYLKEIKEGTLRMSNLIEDLLKLSRISRIKNPYEDVSIVELVNSVVKRIEFDVKQNKVDLIIQPNLPVITCDRIKISEVFLNLINNAIKFSSKNEKVRPRVEVGYADDTEFHKFYVKDNGIGIDPKFHNQIFGIFKRLHASKEYEGTGAGLSIVKRVVDDHGGRVWIESELGKGAAFNFTIPKGLKNEKSEGKNEDKEPEGVSNEQKDSGD